MTTPALTHVTKTENNTNTNSKIKMIILVSVLIVCLGALTRVLYFSYWKMLTGYGENTALIEQLNEKDPRALSAGDLTHFKFGNISFAQKASNLHWKLIALFDNGDGIFERPYSEALASQYRHDADGLGPLYNESSCEGCHVADGRASPPTNAEEPLRGFLFRISIPGVDQHGGPKPHPMYGTQLADKAINGHLPEVKPIINYQEITGVYADGSSYSLRKPIYDLSNAFYGPIEHDALISPRIAPPMIGMGLLDAIDPDDMIALQDIEDANNDGISGKVNWVWDFEKNQLSVGKYGWKAETPTLKQQITDAALNDMGISSAMFNLQNCTQQQHACLDARVGNSDSEFELTNAQLNELETYLEFLAVPARDPLDHPVVQRGEDLFHQANCSGCHVETWLTGNQQRRWRLRGQTIHPYTDLLLHDMGEELSDHRPSFSASGNEWRTAPLWGIGMTQRVNGHTNFLHDGRARNIEEAILWHGGEAEPSKQYFMSLNESERKALITFLKSL